LLLERLVLRGHHVEADTLVGELILQLVDLVFLEPQFALQELLVEVAFAAGQGRDQAGQ
jgi:hypothetical protein